MIVSDYSSNSVVGSDIDCDSLDEIADGVDDLSI